MQQITIKVNNATQTIGETKVVTKSGQPAIIKASKNVNYELIKDATGVAPDHIIAKRIGKDLHVSIEKEGQESDLIIEDFYKYDNSALIGQAEDGRYYYYIPDTGEVADYVTQLKAGDVEGQALGGRDYPAPWWIDMGVGAISAGGFGVPWLVGLAGVVGAGVAIAKNRSDKDDAPTPPTAPTPVVNISIESVADDDIVQHTEQGTQVPVVGKVTGDFSEGNPVVVKINGQDYNTTVDAQGNFSVLVPANELVADPDHIIEATINATSPKGNASATDEHNFTVEAAPQPVPVVNINIDSIATDDIVQNREKGTNVPVVGKVTGDFTAGDEVTVHINGKIYKTPVNDQGNFSVLVPANELVADPDHIIEATINATSPKGNASASGSRGFSVETVVNQAPTVKVAVTIVPKQGEADEGQQVATSQGNDPEGEKLTYGLIPNSDPEGFYAINPNTGVVSLTKKGADHVNAGNDLPPVRVIVSDPHGATGSDKNNVPTTIDVNAPQTAPTVSIVLDANPDDGLINQAEKGNATTTDLRVEIPADAKDGDVISVSDQHGQTLGSFIVGQNGVTAGSQQTISDVPLPAEGERLSVTASIANSAGSLQGNTDSAVIDTLAPTISELVVSPDGSQISGRTEPAAKVTITFPDGQQVVVDADDQGNFALTPTTPLQAGDSISAVATDAAGNPSAPVSAQPSAQAPQTAPTVSIVLDANPDDGLINQAEKGNATTTDLRVEIPADAKDGDVISVSDQHGQTLGSFIVGQNGVTAGSQQTISDVPLPAEGERLSVTASIANSAGSLQGNTDSAVIDTVAGDGNVITITKISEDTGANTSDFKTKDTTLVITGELTKVLEAGEKVQISLDDGQTYQDAQVSDTTWTLDNTGTVLPQGLYKAVARIVDEHGNVSDSIARQDIIIDTTPPEADASTVIIETVASDDKLSADEAASDQVPITGKVLGKFHTGDVITVYVNDVEYHTTLNNQGEFTVFVKGSDLKDDIDSTITASITIKDTVDNTRVITSAPKTYEVITNTAPEVISVNPQVAVSEEGLPKGIADTRGTTDTTNATSATGQLTFKDVDSSQLTVSLEGLTGVQTLGGDTVTWVWNASENALVGSAGGETVMKVSVSQPTATNDNQFVSNYEVVLHKPVLHPENSIEDVLNLKFTVKVSDGTYDASTTLTVAVEDDMPTIANNAQVDISLQKVPVQTNLLVGLDLSNSMTTVEGGRVRLDAVKEALNEVVNKYDTEENDVKVQLVTFGTTATIRGTEWMTVAQAKALIDGLQATEGRTNYEDALAKMMTAFDHPGKFTGKNVQNVSVFLTDGEPTDAMGTDSTLTGEPNRTEVALSAAEEKIWTDWLKANKIDSYAYVVGEDSSVNVGAAINPIAYDGVLVRDTDGVVSNETGKLAETMTNHLGIRAGSATGDGTVFIDESVIAGQLQAGFGADGGYVSQVVIGGATYTYDKATDTITSPTGSVAGHQLVIDTPQGGKLSINLHTAKYVYASATDKNVYQESMTYTVKDNDGDGAESSQTWNVSVKEIDGTLRGTATTEAIDVGLLGLNGEYYGYNDIATDDTYRKHADDTTFGNLDRIADLEGIINGRNGSDIVGTNKAAKAGTPDARFSATLVNYDGVLNSMGTNINVEPGGDTSVLNQENSSFYKFLSFNGNTDNGSITSEAGIGKTTDAAIRVTGNIYLDPGKYDFQVTSDDGFRLMIDGKSLIEFDGITPRQTTTKEGVVVEGGLVPVELLYWEQGSHGVLNFEYRKTGTTEWQTLDLTDSLLLKPESNLELNVLQDAVKEGGQWLVRTGSRLDGSEGTDTIVGSAGRDLIFGDGGNDQMTGGTGADTFVLSTKSGNGNDVITDFTVGSDKIALSAVFNLADIDVNAPNWLNQNSVNNLSWDDGSKTLSYQTEDGEQNSVTFQGVTKSYADADAFLAENLATGDVYVMAGEGNSLSLSQLTDYEVVDLTGTGNNTLTDVTLSNLINNSNSGLYIKGGAGDVVNLGNQATTTDLTDNHNGQSGTWEKGVASVVEDGVTYDVWHNTIDAEQKVFIQQGITVL